MEKNINQLRRELKTNFFRKKDEINYNLSLEQVRIIGEIESTRSEIYNLRTKLYRFNDTTIEGDIKKASERYIALRREKVELDNRRKKALADLNDEYNRQMAELEHEEQKRLHEKDEDWCELPAKTELISAYEKDGIKVEVSRVLPVEGSGDETAYDISVSSTNSGLVQGSVYLNSIAELRLLYGAIRSFMETKDEHNGK